jgi:hypothetical protein
MAQEDSFYIPKPQKNTTENGQNLKKQPPNPNPNPNPLTEGQ